VFDVLLATPVALKDNVKPYQLEHIRHCVLDEADVLLTGSSSQPLLTHVLPALRNWRNAISTQVRRWSRFQTEGFSVMLLEITWFGAVSLYLQRLRCPEWARKVSVRL
jgi:hypothetical protein